MLILRLIFILCAANFSFSFSAEPLARAKIKQATGSIIQQKGKIQTGSSSRIELELPYLAIVRVGSNASFSFTPDYKEMDLKSGTLMASMPKGSGDVILRSGSVAATMAGNGSGTLEMSNIGGNAKLIVLSGKVLASLTKNPNQTKSLRYGQMLDVPAGATSMPAVVAIKLSELIKTSALFNMGDFPGRRAVNQNATKQTGPMKPFVTGGFDPDWGGGSISNTLTIGPPGTAAMIARMETNAAANALPPPLPAGAIPTQAQIVTFEAAGVPIPKSNIRAIQQSNVTRIIEGKRIQRPQPPVVVQPAPQPTPQPTRPPVVVQPTPRPARPPVIRPPVATPRPTIRPPIAPP